MTALEFTDDLFTGGLLNGAGKAIWNAAGLTDDQKNAQHAAPDMIAGVQNPQAFEVRAANDMKDSPRTEDLLVQVAVAQAKNSNNEASSTEEVKKADKALSNLVAALAVLMDADNDGAKVGALNVLRDRMDKAKKALKALSNQRSWASWGYYQARGGDWNSVLYGEIDKFEREIFDRIHRILEQRRVQSRIQAVKFLSFQDAATAHIGAIPAALLNTKNSREENVKRLKSLPAADIQRNFFSLASETYLRDVGMPKVYVEQCPAGSTPVFVDRDGPLDALFKFAIGTQLTVTPTDLEVGYCIGTEGINAEVTAENLFDGNGQPFSDVAALLYRVPSLSGEERASLKKLLTTMTRGMQPPVKNNTTISESLRLLGDEDFMGQMQDTVSNKSNATSINEQITEGAERDAKKRQFAQLAGTFDMALRMKRGNVARGLGTAAGQKTVEDLIREFALQLQTTVTAHKVAKDARALAEQRQATGMEKPELGSDQLVALLTGREPAVPGYLSGGGQTEDRILSSKKALLALASHARRQTSEDVLAIAYQFRTMENGLNIVRAYLAAVMIMNLFWIEHDRRYQRVKRERQERGVANNTLDRTLFLPRSKDMLARYFSTVATSSNSENGVCTREREDDYVFATEPYESCFRVATDADGSYYLEVLIPTIVEDDARTLSLAHQYVRVVATREELETLGDQAKSNFGKVAAFKAAAGMSARPVGERSLEDLAMIEFSSLGRTLFAGGVFGNCMVLYPRENTVTAVPNIPQAICLSTILEFAEQHDDAILALSQDASTEQVQYARTHKTAKFGYFVPSILTLVISMANSMPILRRAFRNTVDVVSPDDRARTEKDRQMTILASHLTTHFMAMGASDKQLLSPQGWQADWFRNMWDIRILVAAAAFKYLREGKALNMRVADMARSVTVGRRVQQYLEDMSSTGVPV